MHCRQEPAPILALCVAVLCEFTALRIGAKAMKTAAVLCPVLQSLQIGVRFPVLFRERQPRSSWYCFLSWCTCTLALQDVEMDLLQKTWVPWAHSLPYRTRAHKASRTGYGKAASLAGCLGCSVLLVCKINLFLFTAQVPKHLPSKMS